MQDELLPALAFVFLNDLCVTTGTERCRDESLGLTPGEERRTMRPGQDTCLDIDSADLVQ